jgi:hypothetical protein
LTDWHTYCFCLAAAQDAGSDMYGGPYPLSEPQARKVRELADRWVGGWVGGRKA